MTRSIILMLDSFGIGAADDAGRFGDEGANTLGSIAKHRAAAGRPLQVPNLARLGLLHAAEASAGKFPEGTAADTEVIAAYGYAGELSSGKDTPSGHWEMAGVPVLFEWGYFTEEEDTFPPELLEELIERGDLAGAYAALPLTLQGGAGSGFGLHPSAGGLHALWQESRLAIVHACGMSTTITRSHFDAQLYCDLGTPGRQGSGTGWLARAWDSDPVGGGAIPLLGVGGSQPASLLGASDALSMASPTEFALNAGPWQWRESGGGRPAALVGVNDVLGSFVSGRTDVEHHARRHGSSKFGRARFWRGFLDLVTVKFLTTYTGRPFHLFGGLGVVMGIVGSALLSWMLVERLRYGRVSALGFASGAVAERSSASDSWAVSSRRTNTRRVVASVTWIVLSALMSHITLRMSAPEPVRSSPDFRASIQLSASTVIVTSNSSVLVEGIKTS